jgi:hypothetical protein
VLKVLHVASLFRTTGPLQLLKFVVLTALVLSFVSALFMVFLPDIFLSLVESAVLTNGSIEDIETFRRLRGDR